MLLTTCHSPCFDPASWSLLTFEVWRFTESIGCSPWNGLPWPGRGGKYQLPASSRFNWNWNLPPDAKPCSTCPLNFFLCILLYIVCVYVYDLEQWKKKNSLASRSTQSVCEHPAKLRAHVKFTSQAQRCSSFWVAKPSMLKLLYPHVLWVTIFWWCRKTLQSSPARKHRAMRSPVIWNQAVYFRTNFSKGPRP